MPAGLNTASSPLDLGFPLQSHGRTDFENASKCPQSGQDL